MAQEGGGVMLAWYQEADSKQRRVLWAGSLGWMLDSMDTMLYALVLSHLMKDFGITEREAGLLGSLTLLSSAIGGVLFGVLADRFGRTWALMASILTYSVFTAASGAAQTLLQLAVCRALLGLGMGGEWATGAALISETWPTRHRGKALGLMQSSWAVGYALAAVVTAIVLPRFGWRAVFFVGVLPALLTLWIRKAVPESELWTRSRAATATQGSMAGVLKEPAVLRRLAIAATVNAATMFAWWGLFTWIPRFLGLPIEKGGAGLDIVKTSTWIVLMQGGMWLGYVSFGFISDRFRPKPTYITYLLIAAVLVPIYARVTDPSVLLVLGPFVAFFGTGYFTGFGVMTAELFPTRIRATAQGLTYNLGRALSAVAPFAVGSIAVDHGLRAAFHLVAVAFLVAGLLAFLLPIHERKDLVAD
ncbi:MFS transporter [Hyalangium sp.]|uniref:MFS transporter n=1 Tax=Hyalangium sp. TaxID=2028555 RepID=UPI002D326923|nr:MFS transporter [Hyalangium sp.]HYI00917.1 MFS transporter [Hyalangium sp.]